MKHRRLLLILGACVFIAVLAFALWPTDDEPVYQGKTLSEWAGQYVSEAYIDSETTYDGPAALGLRAIGTNALPQLFRWLQYNPGRLHHKLYLLSRKLPFRLSDNRVVRGIIREKSELALDYAPAVFCVLGTNASSAVPELARLARDRNRPAVAISAVLCLGRMGAPALPPLLEVLAQPNHPAHLLAFGFMPDMQKQGVDVSSALPLICQGLQEPNTRINAYAAYLLGRLQMAPTLTVPALVSALTNQNVGVRYTCIYALGQFGPTSSNAIARLTALLQDPDQNVRQFATNSIKRIAPDLAAKMFPAQHRRPKNNRQQTPPFI